MGIVDYNVNIYFGVGYGLKFENIFILGFLGYMKLFKI